jgi:predicted Zn-dependent protease
MHNKKGKTKHSLIYFVVLTTLIIVFLVFGKKYLFNSNSQNENQETTNSSSNQTQNSDTSSPEEDTGTQTKDQGYYDSALKAIDNKEYLAAIAFFDKAIAANPNNPAYYSGKAEAQVNLNQQTEAKITLEQGIQTNPDDQLLRSKLDVLNKDFLAPSDQETPKQ